jgi:hypothetical protein
LVVLSDTVLAAKSAWAVREPSIVVVKTPKPDPSKAFAWKAPVKVALLMSGMLVPGVSLPKAKKPPCVAWGVSACIHSPNDR